MRMRTLSHAFVVTFALGKHARDIGTRWREARLNAGLSAVPDWEPTWDTSRSTGVHASLYNFLRLGRMFLLL